MSGMAKLEYASFDLNPCIYDWHEAWTLIPTVGWKKVNMAEVGIGAATMTKTQFDARFPHLPPLPKTAFQAGD
jgi:hypothetical protein